MHVLCEIFIASASQWLWYKHSRTTKRAYEHNQKDNKQQVIYWFM